MLRVFAMKVTGQDFLQDIWKPYLSKRRRQEAKRRHSEKERGLFLGAEVLLNRSMEIVDDRAVLPVAYIRNEYGKPYLLPPADCYVNWSHSGEYVLCAVADQEVGVDLQHMRAEPKEALVYRVLQPEELACYEKKAEEEKKKQFYEYWTVKESFLKAVGTGFYTPLEQFYVCMDGIHPRIIQRERTGSYDCRLLKFADEDYAAAVCCEGEIPAVDIEYL